jgi:hypothetical protein
MVIFNSYVSLPEGIYFLSPIHLPHRPRAVSAINSAASRGARRRRLEDTMDTAGVMGAESSPISHLASQACWDWKIHGEDDQWEFQDPKMEVPIPYIRPIFQGYVRGYPPKIWPYMVQYLHFRILKFPLSLWQFIKNQVDCLQMEWTIPPKKFNDCPIQMLMSGVVFQHRVCLPITFHLMIHVEVIYESGICKPPFWGHGWVSGFVNMSFSCSQTWFMGNWY